MTAGSLSPSCSLLNLDPFVAQFRPGERIDHRRDRVAGRQIDQKKGDDGHAEEHWHRNGEPPQNVLTHERLIELNIDRDAGTDSRVAVGEPSDVYSLSHHS